VLSSFEDPDLAFRRRGAPFTFDADGCVKFAKVLKYMPVTTSKEPELFIHAPSFDHAKKDPVPDAISISSRSRLVIVEGNYTLLNQSPWIEIANASNEKFVVTTLTVR
jgi:pantothenate kinase